MSQSGQREGIDAFWRNEALCFEWIGHRETHARFEFSSRGDRVEGWLHARAGEIRPLVVLVAGGAAADANAEACAEALVERGAAVARIDLPLHGTRESVKLSTALREAASDLPRLARDGDAARLVDAFLCQARWDLRGVIASLGAEASVDTTRVACVGVDLGALSCAHGAAPNDARAVVLSRLPLGGPDGVDPEAALAAFAPRPVLRSDDGLETLADAAGPFLAEALGF